MNARARLWSWLGPALVIVATLGLFFGLRAQAALDVTMHHPHGHFYIVTLVSVLALLLAIAVGIAGIKLRNVNVTFLSVAYVSLAEVFAVHGLTTPGFMIHDVQTLPRITAQLSILLACSWIGLSALPTDHALVKRLAGRQRLLLPAWSLALLAFGICTLVSPRTIEALPINLDPYKWIATAVTAAICLFAMYRYRETYLLTGFPLHICIAYSSGLLIVSQVIMVAGSSWQLSWWLYHYTLLASMLIMLFGVARQYLSLETIGSMFRILFRPDPRAWIAAAISPSVRALITQTERKDAYTAGHNYRVALYGLRLAEEMGVDARQLRAMAQGGIVHDVGKVYILDEILNKPGRLTPEERSVIEQHPLHGYNLCKRMGFMSEELGIVRSHHERWDGTGYPDRLRGEQIPLLARIIAVADVYDALTSTRAYRTAMSHEQATAVIASESGKHFDPACVAAWLELGERDPAFFRSTRGQLPVQPAWAQPIAGA